MVIAFAVGSFESGTFFRIIDVCVTAVYIYRQVVYRAAEKQQFFPFSIRHAYYGPEGNKSLPKVCIIYFFFSPRRFATTPPQSAKPALFPKQPSG